MIPLKLNKGFTLIEIVLYVGICSFILLSFSIFLSFLLTARVRSQSITEVNQQGFQVLHRITQAARNGRNIQNPDIGAQGSILTLITSDPLLNPTVFSVSSSTFFIQEGSNTPVALTNSRIRISGLTFQNISSVGSTEKIVRVTFVVDHVNLEGRPEYSYTKVFSGSATIR